MNGLAEAVCSALANQSRKELAEARQRDAARPIGETRLDIDFYSKAESDKPVEDYDFHAHGNHYQGFGGRWCVVRQRWTGDRWQRVRKLTGPLQFTAALDRCAEMKRRATGDPA